MGARSGGLLSTGRQKALLGALVVLAALLQLSRIPFRWNAISIAYASYFKEWLHVVDVGGPLAPVTTFVGLHPPAYSLLFWAMVSLGVAPLVWHLVSGLLSVAAVPVVWAAARRAWSTEAGAAALVTAAVLAVSPHRNAYGLEVNNYPLLVLATSLQLWAFSAWAADTDGRRRIDVAYAAATALALFTHVLAIALPASQLLALLLHPTGRARLKRFAGAQAAAAVPCLLLLPAILERTGAPPINDPAGLLAAIEAAAIGFPTRYGSGLGAAGVGAGLAFGLWRVLGTEEGRRELAPISWVVHGGLVLGLIVWMVATGTAAAHQFPYYVAVLPTGALLVGAAATARPGLRRRLVLWAVALGLVLHAAGQGLAYAMAQTLWNASPVTHSLVDHAVDQWTEGSVLLLVQFPQFGDDDKDFVDPAWAHLPMGDSCRFEHPGVPQLVTADPYAGQPVLLGGRWLYTFTQFVPERIDPIVRHHREAGVRVVIAMTETNYSPGEVASAERWASTYPGVLGTRVGDQVLWVVEPPR
ncbi:MAG: hypothetical protein GY898_29755 [Proteobacteria bacterium]|nr:hypothetical protein [Pseudomonadota bacterium]